MAASSFVMPCVRNSLSFRASSSESVTTIPPSPVVMCLTGWKEKTVMSARDPTGRPL